MADRRGDVIAHFDETEVHLPLTVTAETGGLVSIAVGSGERSLVADLEPHELDDLVAALVTYQEARGG